MLLKLSLIRALPLELVSQLALNVSRAIFGLPARGAFEASPLDLVLNRLLGEANPLKHISDVVDPSLLHSKHLCCVVEIHTLLRRLLDKLNELSSELAEAVLDSRLLTLHNVRVAFNRCGFLPQRR